MLRSFFAMLSLCTFLGQSLAVAQTTLSVNPGEQVALTIKLINVGNFELYDIQVQLDPQATPAWIWSEARAHQSVDVPVKSVGEDRQNATLPLIFTVGEQAPEDAEASLRLLIRDGQGHLWTQTVPLKVLPRPKPKESQLFQNYPNPFNPETWIPYQLAQPVQVRISIYESSGRLVRTLDLGHQRAGLYTSRTEAAYWDGRNETGERVSSGLYFYQLQTDHFSAMRRMVIIK